LVVRAGARLCANTDDLDEKQHCLEALLELEPGLDWAQAALLDMQHRLLREN